MLNPANNILLHINNIRKNTTVSNVEALSKKDTFTSLLDNCLKEIGTGRSAEGEMPDLDLNQIDLLVKKVQIQMNYQLINAVLNTEEEISFSPSIIGSDTYKKIASYEVNASKNRQALPKNFDDHSRINLESIIKKAAVKYDVDPDLIRSVIKAESNFDKKATSYKGAMGLMQLMPETAKDLGVRNAYDAEENVMGGTRYLKTLLDRYNGHVDLALAAYNWGMGNLEKKPDCLPAETVTYISRINNYYKNLKA
jgi:soluble lytic murein transglycosylase-like protein